MDEEKKNVHLSESDIIGRELFFTRNDRGVWTREKSFLPRCWLVLLRDIFSTLYLSRSPEGTRSRNAHTPSTPTYPPSFPILLPIVPLLAVLPFTRPSRSFRVWLTVSLVNNPTRKVNAAPWSFAPTVFVANRFLFRLTTCAGNWLRTITSDQTVYNNSSLSFRPRRYNVTG